MPIDRVTVRLRQRRQPSRTRGRAANSGPHPPEPGTPVSTGSPGCHSAEVHSGVGDGRGGAGGGFEPRLGFWATEPDPPDPVRVVPEPLDLPEPLPTSADESLVAREAEVFDGDGVPDAVTERLGEGLGDATPLDELTDADTELTGELSTPEGSPAPAPPPAEHPTTHRTATTTAALRTAAPRGQALTISSLSSSTCLFHSSRKGIRLQSGQSISSRGK